MICYPMGLPEWDFVRQCLEGREDQSSADFGGDDLDPATSQLWFASRALAADKPLSEYLVGVMVVGVVAVGVVAAGLGRTGGGSVLLVCVRGGGGQRPYYHSLHLMHSTHSFNTPSHQHQHTHTSRRRAAASARAPWSSSPGRGRARPPASPPSTPPPKRR